MKKGRLEAFSDGVMAIIITIMILEIRAPENTNLKAILPILPIFINYILSFIYVGIYWNNHHHLFQITEKVNGVILWANLHLLFWISLIPFATSWMDENYFAPIPVAVYGLVLLFCAIAYKILKSQLVRTHDEKFPLNEDKNSLKKENISIIIYILAILFSWISTLISIAGYVLVAVLWFLPSKKLENYAEKNPETRSRNQ